MTDPLDGVINYLRGLRSDRRLLNLIYASVQRLEIALSTETEFVTTALASLDTQMSNLQTRLADDATALAAAIAAAVDAGVDAAALTEAGARIQATADLVGTLAMPTVVADPAVPDVVADPLV